MNFPEIDKETWRMSMPQFNAEASLGPAGTYARKAIHGGRPGSANVLPSQSARFRFNPFPVMRCCGFDPFLGRFVCVSRRASPLQNCRCEKTSLGPLIVCRDPVFDSAT